MTLVAAIVNATGISAILYSSWLFDRLARYEYEHHREQWERDGRPIGVYWRPSETTIFRSRAGKNWWRLAWLFHTPRWARSSSQCRAWLLQIRCITLLWGVIVFRGLLRHSFLQ